MALRVKWVIQCETQENLAYIKFYVGPNYFFITTIRTDIIVTTIHTSVILDLSSNNILQNISCTISFKIPFPVLLNDLSRVSFPGLTESNGRDTQSTLNVCLHGYNLQVTQF